jgi:hypothetical protein
VSLEWDDVVDVLTLCAAYDRRTVGKFDIQAWLDALKIAGVTSREDALQAVRVHHAGTTDWCKPSHVAAGVRSIRSERFHNVTDSELMAGVDESTPGVQWVAILRSRKARIADGATIPQAIGAVPAPSEIGASND